MDEDNEKAYRWEGDYEKTWEALREDDSGSLQASIDAEINKAKKRRLLKKQRKVRLGMMRHIFIVLDMSQAMTDQDLKPNRALVVLKVLQKFVENFFDQNPIGQLGFIITRAKRAESLSEMSGTSQSHIKSLMKLSSEITATNAKSCTGEPSLQNSLELAEKTLKNMPSHTSREVVVIMGSLTSCDPSPIYDTIEHIKMQKIRCSVIGLSAEVHICRHLANETGGTFGVILDQTHFVDLLNDHIDPPSGMATESSLIKMGFPQHIPPHENGKVSMCMSTKQFSVGGYYCPQCQSKYSELPVQCEVCSLTLVSAPHLARSYHHLFPLPQFSEIQYARYVHQGGREQNCFSCLKNLQKGSESSVHQCNKCKTIFCLDCNVFMHVTLHCCPGCINSRCEI
ncbi:general transcription factor IIH subunit 2-like [Clavelina lepadiformis]|uniref:general transcription factor IIH subunit 2-like n=1 Tax=Clavelina lepadiformis TaxID=159417 RepID=UPI0040427A76